MKIVKFLKAHWGALTAGILTVVLACSLIVAISILSEPDDSDALGVIDASTVDEGVMRYTQKTDAYFKEAFKEYYNKLFANLLSDLQVTVKASEVINPEALSSAILKAFKNGQVSADKVLALADYLKASNPSDVVEGIIIAYLVPATDENGDIIVNEKTGETLYEFSDVADYDKLAALNIMPMQLIKDILENTTITSDDLGSIFYHMLLNSSAGSYKDVLQELGLDGFNAVFVNGITIYQILTTLQGGVTLTDIRNARELMFSTGRQYNDILERLGKDDLQLLTGGIKNIVLESSSQPSAFGVAFSEATESMASLLPATLSMLGYVFMNIPSDFPEALEKAVNDGNKEATAKAVTQVAQMLLAGINQASAYSGKSETELIDDFANLSGALDCINDGSSDIQTAKNNSLNSINRTLDIINEIAALGDDANADVVLNLLSDIEIDKDTFEGGINRLASVALYNALISLLMNAYEE